MAGAEFGKRIEGDAPSFGNWSFVIRSARKAILRGQEKPLTMAEAAACVAAARAECIDIDPKEQKEAR
jgi:hypothetical protein